MLSRRIGYYLPLTGRSLSTSIDLSRCTILEASEALAKGNLQAEELTSWSLDNLEKGNVKFNYLTGEVWKEYAQEAAQAAGTRIREGKRNSLLDGIPITIKDNFTVKGEKTTAASNILGDWVSPFDAAPVESLKAAGAILTGKNNMDEFGMGSASVFSRYGPVISPWSPCDGDEDSKLSAGGSSGGGAACVASGGSFAALGSDTGGSVRQPAAWCGIVGLKPSFGRVSRHGLLAYVSSLDCPGIMSRSVGDAALLLDCLATSSPDTRDSLSAIAPPHNDSSFLDTVLNIQKRNESESCLSGMVIGIPKEYSVEGLHSSSRDAWLTCMKHLEGLGAEIVSVSIPSVSHALPAYYVIACAEASSNLAKLDGLRYGTGVEEALTPLHDAIMQARSQGFGEEVQRRILCGTYVLSASSYASYYEQALLVRNQLRHDFKAAFTPQGGKRVDVLLTPSAPTPPVTVASALSDANENKRSPIEAYAHDVMTVPASMGQLCALSLPVMTTQISTKNHKSNIEVPVGVQLMAPRFDERTLLKVSGALESVLQFRIPDHVHEL